MKNIVWNVRVWSPKHGEIPTTPQVFWHGETTCNVCRQPIKGELFDARTRMGPWATLCKKHFNMLGPGKLGTGFGQRYEEQPNGRWLKVEE